MLKLNEMVLFTYLNGSDQKNNNFKCWEDGSNGDFAYGKSSLKLMGISVGRSIYENDSIY